MFDVRWKAREGSIGIEEVHWSLSTGAARTLFCIEHVELQNLEQNRTSCGSQFGRAVGLLLRQLPGRPALAVGSGTPTR